METAIFLVVLAAIGLVVLYLMWHKESASQAERAAPLTVEQPLAVVAVPMAPVASPPPVEPKVIAPTPIALAPPVVEVAKTPTRPKKAATPGPGQPPKSGVTAALALLKDRDSLAAAFVLREIFAPPISRRR